MMNSIDDSKFIDLTECQMAMFVRDNQAEVTLQCKAEHGFTVMVNRHDILTQVEMLVPSPLTENLMQYAFGIAESLTDIVSDWDTNCNRGYICFHINLLELDPKVVIDMWQPPERTSMTFPLETLATREQLTDKDFYVIKDALDIMLYELLLRHEQSCID